MTIKCISKTRLDGLIELMGNGTEIWFLLRELRDYRKAVREYLEAVDALKNSHIENVGYWGYVDKRNAADAAETNLRALQERT